MAPPRTSFFTDINRAHPDPYKWADNPIARPGNKRTVAKCLQDIGESHNSFQTQFKGIQVPLDKLTVVGPDSSPILGDFETEIYRYGALFLHLTPHDRNTGFPALLTCAAGKGTSIVIALYEFKTMSENPLAIVREHFPVIYRALEDVHILKLTASYDALKPCLSKYMGARSGRDLIDVLQLASISRPKDFSAFEAIRRPTEGLALQTLVWSYNGVQQGPMPAEHQWHKFQDTPWSESRHAMYQFTRGVPPTPHQLLWNYQVMKASVMAAADVVNRNAREPEKEWGEEQMPAVYNAGLQRFQSQHNLNHGGYFVGLRQERTIREPEPPQPMLRGGVPSRISILNPPTTQASASYKRHGQYMSPSGPHGPPGERWDRSRRPSGPRPQSGSWNNSIDMEAGLRKPKRRSSSPLKGPGPQPKKTAFQLDLDREIRKRRSEFREQNPTNMMPLGEGCCKDCGQSPPHERPEDCIVHQLKEDREGVGHEDYPCQYCGFDDHITYACPFGHTRCSKCNHTGHLDIECHRRTLEEWLVLYLLFVLSFKGPQSHPGGPLGGTYGFGRVNTGELLEATRVLLRDKEQELTRRQTSGKFPTGSQELQAGWMALIAERKTQGPQVNAQLVSRLEQALARCSAAAPPLPPPPPPPSRPPRTPSTRRPTPSAPPQPPPAKKDNDTFELEDAEKLFGCHSEEPMEVGSNVTIRTE